MQDSLLPEGSNLTTNEDEESNFLSILMADGLRRRKFSPNANYGGAVFDKSSIPTTNIINSAPTKGKLYLVKRNPNSICRINSKVIIMLLGISKH